MNSLTPFIAYLTEVSRTKGGPGVRAVLKEFEECRKCGGKYRKRKGCRVCGFVKPTKVYAPNKTKAKQRYVALKEQVFKAYGGFSCACCGEPERTILTIDHINNDGAEHRKKLNKSFYMWLKESNFPGGFQVLCFNCNIGKYRNGGTCYHRRVLQKTFQ